MVPNMATLFLFFIEENRRTRRKTLFFFFYSFCLFFLLPPKKRKKRVRNKTENRKKENRKKRTEKEYLFSVVNKSHFFGFFSAPPFCFFDNPTPPFICPNSGTTILCLRQSDTASFLFSAMRHRNFLCVLF